MPIRGRSISADTLRDRYGCTGSQSRLVSLLAEGRTLRHAADAMGITYGSARVYLKTVFEKTGVHSQAQLVARVHGAGGLPPGRKAG